MAALQAQFKQLYLDYNINTFAYPRIDHKCVFVNCYDARHMDWLRDHIYDFVMRYKPPGESYFSFCLTH